MRRLIKNIADPNLRRELELIWDRLNFIETKGEEPTTSNLAPGEAALYDGDLYVNDRQTIRKFTISGGDGNYLKADGSVDLTGNLAVDSGVTVDGVDIGAHGSRHESGGADEVKLDDLGAPDDNTDLDASTSKHGLCKKGDGDTSHFLRGDLAWEAPPNNPAGNDHEIQFNDGGVFGADADFVWRKNSNRLGIGEADPESAVEITQNDAVLTLHNPTHQAAAGERNTHIKFKGEEADGTEHVLCEFYVCQAVSLGDQEANLYIKLNDGNDGNSPTQRLLIRHNGSFRITGRIGLNGVDPEVALDIRDQTLPYLWLTNLSPEDLNEGRETRICFRGTGSGMQYDDTLAMIEGNHDGSLADQRGNLIFKTNGGSDDDAPTERMRIDSNGLVSFNKGMNIVCHNNEVICHNDEVVFS